MHLLVSPAVLGTPCAYRPSLACAIAHILTRKTCQRAESNGWRRETPLLEVDRNAGSGAWSAGCTSSRSKLGAFGSKGGGKIAGLFMVKCYRWLVADSTTGTLNRPIAVLIAYHFSTVCMVGQIVVIEENRHAELILKGTATPSASPARSPPTGRCRAYSLSGKSGIRSNDPEDRPFLRRFSDGV